MPSFAVILAAGGSSVRFGADKLHQRIADESIIGHSLMAFLQRGDVSHVIVVHAAAADPIGVPSIELRPLLDHNPRFKTCPGGENRAASVLAGLRRVPETVEWVAIHDAARPMVSQDLITRTFKAALECGCAVPAMPVQLTIKQAPGPLPADVVRTIPRHELWAMQTPQIMRRRMLLDAFAACPIPLDQVTDDAQLIELVGKPVRLIPGEEANIKITTQLDLLMAEAIWRMRRGAERAGRRGH